MVSPGSSLTPDPPEETGSNDARPRQRFTLGNRPALTGIRALGVSLVLIFHSNFRTLPGSWVALGIFFVLSGFLITSMLAIEHDRTNRISLSKFYTRRAVRLLPPLFLTVALLGIYAAIVPVWNAGNRIWGDSAAALFYFADYRSAFGHEPALGFLAQCWSLAVEEQFYLIWAALLVVALRYGSRKLAYALAITGIVICTANRVWIVLHAQHWNSYVAGRAYYAFDTRGEALFLGCLLGLIATGGHFENWRPWAKQGLVWVAVASLAVMIWIILTVSLAPRSLPLVWLPVSEIASAVFIVYFVVHPKGLGTRALSIPVLVFAGEMSYTIYLIHWPIYVAISPYTVRWSFWVMEAARLAIIVPLALASWYLMERPLMRWRRSTLDPAKKAVSVGAAPDPTPSSPSAPTLGTAPRPTVPTSLEPLSPAPSSAE